MTSLEVKEHGQIWLIPDAPNWDLMGRTQDDVEDYYDALASAERYLVSNQEVARELLYDHIEKNIDRLIRKRPRIKLGIYPIPDLKWEVKEDPETVHYTNPVTGNLVSHVVFRKVAVISIPESLSENSEKDFVERIRGGCNELEWQQITKQSFIDYLIRTIAFFAVSDNPKHMKADEHAIKQRIAKELKASGYSLRQIQKALGYKSVRSIHLMLNQNEKRI